MRQALGKGIGALIPSAPSRRGSAVAAQPAHEPPLRSGIRHVPVDAIEVNPNQPRANFDEQALDELARSIAETGILQPLLVRTLPGGERFQLIAGERRWRACKRAQLAEVPVLVREATDQESLLLAIVENVQRADLDAIEEARAYRALIEEFALTQEEVARRVGKSRPAVSNALRLLQLPEETQADIVAGRLSAGHARALLALDSDDARRTLAREVIQRQLTVREAERVATKARSQTALRRDPDVGLLESELGRALGTKVRVVPAKGGSGRIEIEYYSDDDLGRLADRLRRPAARKV